MLSGCPDEMGEGASNAAKHVGGDDVPCDANDKQFPQTLVEQTKSGGTCRQDIRRKKSRRGGTR
jgi:hypothetical protein